MVVIGFYLLKDQYWGKMFAEVFIPMNVEFSILFLILFNM